MKKVYGTDEEIDTLFILSANKKGQIVRRTITGSGDRKIDSVRLESPLDIAFCENEILVEAYAEIQGIIDAEKMSKETRKRHEVYFGKVISIPLGTQKEFDSCIIKKSQGNQANGHIYSILLRNYDIVGIDDNFKVSKTITLIRVR
jgi:hypothetical protein